MRPVPFYYQVKLLLSVCSLISIALCGIKNWKNRLIFDPTSHVNIALKVTHQNAIFPFWCVILHYLKLVIRVNYRFSEFYMVGRLRLGPTLSLRTILITLWLCLNWVPEITGLIINKDMSTMLLVDLVHFELIWMNGDIWINLAKDVMDWCVNDVTDPTTDDVHWNFSFVQYLK